MRPGAGQFCKNKHQDCQELQQDLNELAAWSDKWLLDFNASKCVVMKVKQKQEYVYTLNREVLTEVQNQKDLGVYVSNDLMAEKHISEICKKANQRIGMIRRCYTDLTRSKVEKLYKANIRSLLEYCSPVWSPYLQKDIDKLEAVQKRCLKLSNNEFTLPTLNDRRLEADIKETFKFLENKYITKPERPKNRPCPR